MAQAQATPANYAVVNASGVVVNIIVWDGVTPWAPPAGCTAVLAGPGARIGATYSGGVFTPPSPPAPPTPTSYLSTCPNCGFMAVFGKVPAQPILKCPIDGTALPAPTVIYT